MGNNYEFKGTKGEWSVKGRTNLKVVSHKDGLDYPIASVDYFDKPPSEMKENASLIALAGNLAKTYDPSTWESILKSHPLLVEALKESHEEILSVYNRVPVNDKERQQDLRTLMAKIQTAFNSINE